MNSFEADIRRAVCSKGFAAGLVIEVLILFYGGFDSGIFRMCVPVIAAFPYATAWLSEYKSGYIKAYLPRTGVTPYILGKFLACGISGGLLEFLGCGLYVLTGRAGTAEIRLLPVFFSGALWAVLAATLAAWSNNRYIAYGGAFVIYYLLVMLYERYFEGLYCLYPYEWLMPTHTWVLGEQGVLLLLAGIILVLFCLYYEILRRYIGRV